MNFNARELYCCCPSNDELQKVTLEITRRRLEEIEFKCRMFIIRTGLKPQECCLVYFRGNAFPQWIGAVPTRRESAV